jgi:hypothetical protein
MHVELYIKCIQYAWFMDRNIPLTDRENLITILSLSASDVTEGV